MSEKAYLCVDRIAGETAVLERDDRTFLEVPARALPQGCREGDCLYRDASGALVIDAEETARRRKKNFDLFRSLIDES